MLRLFLATVFLLSSLATLHAQDAAPRRSVFAKDNLVAWCIVPFDAKKRGPEQRAQMVRELGITRVAYDWRAEHVATFEREILAYQKHDIDFFAFWSWHDSLEPLIDKHNIKPQIWITAPSPDASDQPGRIKAAAEKLLPLVEKTRRLDLKLGLYNHGGWGGMPSNLVAVCEYLHREHNAHHVGIVYNFHHGHDHAADFAVLLEPMVPHLHCLNLNGMVNPKRFDVTKQTDKIRPIGSGTLETEMMKAVRQSKYNGPIGILDHRNDLDTRQALERNLQGMQQVLTTIGDDAAKSSY